MKATARIEGALAAAKREGDGAKVYRVFAPRLQYVVVGSGESIEGSTLARRSHDTELVCEIADGEVLPNYEIAL